ncbi:MAG: sodium:solute symporter, partial [Saprospiraceae bacterium]|nr:sodium:solute symporter [Saprospiraceae bacterium]
GIELPTKTVNGITKTDSDMLFPTLAMYHFPMAIAILFVLGMVASAYSSVDSALTALTTTFCMDFLDFDKLQWDEQRKIRTRVTVHIGFALLMLLVIVIFGFVKNEAVIKAVFDVAGYTYGPLLGLFAFGFYTRYKIHDRWSVWVCLAAPILTYFLDKYSVTLFFGYKFGFEKLIINGLLTFIGLWLIAKRKK